VDKYFGDANIQGILGHLVRANIDYIEVGFLQNSGFGEGKTVFKNSSDVSKVLAPFKAVEKNPSTALTGGPSEEQKIFEDRTGGGTREGLKFVCLADSRNYNPVDLDPRSPNSFDAIRVTYLREYRPEETERLAKIALDYGYEVFVQPVDIKGYTDEEFLEQVRSWNNLRGSSGQKISGIAIVDTFGSLYLEDLERYFNLIHANLDPDIVIDFHSHNNLQMSSALAQYFVRLCNQNGRNGVVDVSLNGLGRGAGNTPTELIVQYMNEMQGANYNLDEILDAIDQYINNLRFRADWGYTTETFVAGKWNAHMNNIHYLQVCSSLLSANISRILNKIDRKKRERYDYELLQRTYLEEMSTNYDDTNELLKLNELLNGRAVLLVAPGSSVKKESDSINEWVRAENAAVIAINVLHPNLDIDYLYLNNPRRYARFMTDSKFARTPKILTDNVVNAGLAAGEGGANIVVNFASLLKTGWKHMDNSALLALRLLDKLEPSKIGIAGLDGFLLSTEAGEDYTKPDLELRKSDQEASEANADILSMLRDYMEHRTHSCPVEFVTESRFA
jgi:4-hydroxy 2-oxovalerate aldolase